jgi:2',3'-cyclic-nucleotide 2'-phosphodiesterase (5'-nucleotidase family)
MKRFFLICISLFALSAACRHTGEISNSNTIQLEGIVQSVSGEPLSGITVEIGGIQKDTDAAGRFTLEGVQQDRTTIYLHGNSGTGQYRVNLNQSAEPFEFTYPVITEIVLLHDNDLHFNYNHKEAFVAKTEEIRDRYDNVWLLNAGDTFVRHAARWAVDDTSYYADRSLFMIQTMNEVGYDVGVPGNHEIDYVGKHTRVSLMNAEFPLIASNIDIATQYLPLLKPYVILETANGLTAAILGLSTVNFDKPGVTQRDHIETVMAYNNLARENNLFVVLSHIGFSADEALAEAVPELDVIVGGHSHTLLETAKVVNGVLVAQAGGPPPQHQVDPEWPKFLGKVKVVLENGVVVKKEGHVITIGEPVEAE